MRAEAAALKHEQAARDQAAGDAPPHPRPLPPLPAPKPLLAEHSGSWRGPGRRYRCSLANDESSESGPVCQHGSIIVVDHWSCCGELDEGAACTEAQGGASANEGSDTGDEDLDSVFARMARELGE